MLSLYSRKRWTQLVVASLFFGATAFAYAAPADNALPTGFNGIVGANTPVVNGNVMDIKQDANVKVGYIKWDTFNIGKDATVNILQNSSKQTMINQVVGSGLSEIYGKLNAKGTVVLINPKGVVFANGCQVNVGGLAVYAADTKVDKDFNLLAVKNDAYSTDVKIEEGAQIAISQGLSNLGFKGEDYKLPEAGYGEGRLVLVATNDIVINAKNCNLTVGNDKELGDIFLLSNSDMGSMGDVKINGVVVKKDGIWQDDAIKGNIKSEKSTSSKHPDSFVASASGIVEATASDAIPFIPEVEPTQVLTLEQFLEMIGPEALARIENTVGSTQAESDEEDDSETLVVATGGTVPQKIVQATALYKSLMKNIKNTPKLNKY